MVYEELAGSTFVNSFQNKSKAGNFSYFFSGQKILYLNSHKVCQLFARNNYCCSMPESIKSQNISALCQNKLKRIRQKPGFFTRFLFVIHYFGILRAD